MDSNNEDMSEQIIPVLEEEYSVSKEIIEPSKIEKKWIKKTKIIKVPITHEEVYINDKKMRFCRIYWIGDVII